MKIHQNCLDIIPHYDGFLVDVWGVLHSSGVAYDNAHNAMLEMMKIAPVVLLSNAPRRALKVEKFLASIGFTKGVHFSNILTSGEAFIKHAVQKGYHQVFYIGPDKDLDLLHSTGISITQRVDDYFDDAVLTGLVQDNNNIEPDIQILQKLLEKQTAISCVNPDIVVKVGDGHQLCAGAVAREYEKMGGVVNYFGKPYVEVYNMAFEMLNEEANKRGGVLCNNILAIGDGMETDILGAQNARIKSILCVSGIHQKEIIHRGIELFLADFTQKPNHITEAL